MDNIKIKASRMEDTFRKACIYKHIYNAENWLYVSITEQHMYHVDKNTLINYYPISSSKKPSSCIEDSYGTPWGLHKIEEKIGNAEPEGTIFNARRSTGKVYQDAPINNKENLITSRILRLQGLEKGINLGNYCDSYKRYIYIHGSNNEESIGKKRTSNGCIHMKNKDIINLYKEIKPNTLVYIEKD